MRNKIIIGVSILFLTACHHDNPLKTHSKSESAIFLMNASANAEKRLQFSMKTDERGYGYLECMEGKNNTEIDCAKLFTSIVQFAKEDHFKGFKSLTLADLTDKTVFDSMGDTYAEVLVSTWPTYY